MTSTTGESSGIEVAKSPDTDGSEIDQSDSSLESSPPNRNRLYIWLGAGGFLVMVVFWAVLYLWPNSVIGKNPDTLTDKAWVASSSAICTPVARTIKYLPNATSTKTAAERATLLDRGTVVLEPMVAKLNALDLPSNVNDRKIVTGWLADWKVYLQDRRNFAVALRKNPKAQPLFTEVHGGWSSDAIDAMANANNAPDCATPGDM